MSKLSNFAKLFIASNTFLWTGGYVFNVILGFYIWGENNDLQKLIIYTISWTFFVLVGAFAAEVLLQRFLSVRIRIVSILLTAIAAFLVTIVNIKSDGSLIGIGGLMGFAAGLRAIPYNIIYQLQIESRLRGVFNSYNNLFYYLIILVFPFLITQVIDRTGNYLIIFILGLIFIAISIVPLLFSTAYVKNEPKKRMDLRKAIVEVRRSNNLLYLLLLKFFNGIHHGLELSILAVIGLYLVDDIGNWGMINALSTILLVILYYTLSKRLTFEKAPIFFTAFSLLYASITLLFAINLSFIWYLIFLAAYATKSALVNEAFGQINSKIIDRRVEELDSIDEFLLISEIPIFAGRILPLVLLYILGADFSNSLGLSIVLSVIALVPLITTFIVERMTIVKSFRDPFIAN